MEAISYLTLRFPAAVMISWNLCSLSAALLAVSSSAALLHPA